MNISDILFGLNPLQIFLISASIIGAILAGNKNDWSWAFSILTSVVLLAVGIIEGMPLFTFLGAVYILLELRGAYIWIFKNNKHNRFALLDDGKKTFCCPYCGKESYSNELRQKRHEMVFDRKEEARVAPLKSR